MRKNLRRQDLRQATRSKDSTALSCPPAPTVTLLMAESSGADTKTQRDSPASSFDCVCYESPTTLYLWPLSMCLRPCRLPGTKEPAPQRQVSASAPIMQPVLLCWRPPDTTRGHRSWAICYLTSDQGLSQPCRRGRCDGNFQNGA